MVLFHINQIKMYSTLFWSQFLFFVLAQICLCITHFKLLNRLRLASTSTWSFSCCVILLTRKQKNTVYLFFFAENMIQSETSCKNNNTVLLPYNIHRYDTEFSVSAFFRSPKHWRKPVGGCREEGWATACPGWRRRRSGGAPEQPEKRLNTQ